MVVVAETDAVQPTELVTVTVQVPAVLTDMVRVVAPFDHRYAVKPAPASSVVDPPGQKFLVPLMDGVGGMHTRPASTLRLVSPWPNVTQLVLPLAGLASLSSASLPPAACGERVKPEGVTNSTK